MHGFWHGLNNPMWNHWGLGWGWGMGWGLAGWGMGSGLWNLGLATYANPYFIAAAPVAGVAAPVYDYSRPIDTTAALPSAETADPAMQAFDDARAAFREGDYARALTLTDQALAALPNDATLHEFRALALFAQGRYDQAAGVLYAVLSVGPGWDWATMVGLYPNVEVYTRHLRALESYAGQNPNAAAPRFVLAYHYLTTGDTAAAASMLREVVRLQPSDQLSAAMLGQLTGTSTATAEERSPAPPASPSLPGTPPAGPQEITGTWAANPDADRAITLTLRDDNTFTWAFAEKGQVRQTMEGDSSYGNGMLTLVQPGGATLVGQVTVQPDGRLRFRLVAGSPSDPGLDFRRAATP
jgi:tetratricopeptide (TPR) repeat protein